MGIDALRCPIAFVDERDLVWRCQLHYGHRQWHSSFEHGNPGTIWPHQLGREIEVEAVVEEVVVQEVAPAEPVIREQPAVVWKHKIRFSEEDWAENVHFSANELLHASSRRYGIPPESMIWWDDEYEACKGWEPESGKLPWAEMRMVNLMRKHWSLD